MSTHIIDGIAAVKFPKERTGYSIDYYLIATLGGDNNLIDCRTNKRARSWNPWRAGQHYTCLAWACEFAGDFCGGTIRMGRATPEGFIKACRKCLDTAPDYDSRDAIFRIGETAITFDAEQREERKYYFERLVQQRGPAESRKAVYLRGDVDAFPFDFTNPREAAVFIEHLPYKTPLWHHLRIHGPGTI